MVNLNAPRNLPPDNTPWGKAIERRLNDLEKANNLLATKIRNNGKGLNSLNTRIGGLSFESDSTGLQSATVAPNPEGTPDIVTSGRTLRGSEYYMAPGPTVEMDSRSGRVVVIGQVDLSITPESGSLDQAVFLIAGISVYDRAGTELIYPIPQFPFNTSTWFPRSSNRAGVGSSSYNNTMTYMFTSGENSRVFPSGSLTFEPTIASYNLNTQIDVFFSTSVLTVISL